MKITFGMIVFNSDFVLQQCLESIYPYAYKILIAEGCVKYLADKGQTVSHDKTCAILHNFPDPDNKIIITHGVYEEKTDQCRAWFKDVPDDTDYVWCIDADEIFKPDHIEKVITFLKEYDPTSVGFRSITFFGGFTNTL